MRHDAVHRMFNDKLCACASAFLVPVWSARKMFAVTSHDERDENGAEQKLPPKRGRKLLHRESIWKDSARLGWVTDGKQHHSICLQAAYCNCLNREKSDCSIVGTAKSCVEYTLNQADRKSTSLN